MRTIGRFPFLCFMAIQLVKQVDAQDFRLKAIEPVSSGQIGVNLVDYVGSNTQYYSADPTSTKWIGVDSVIVQTITQISNGAPVTLTTSAAIAVSTATVAAPGVSVGDVSFTITPNAKVQLEELFKKIAAACGAVKLKSRQAESCVADYILEEAAAESIINDVYIAKFLDGAGNLIEYTWEGIKDFEIAEEGLIALGGAAVAYLGYQMWDPNGSDGRRVPDVIKIAASQISTHTVSPSSTTSAERQGQTPPAVLHNFFNNVADDFDPIVAQGVVAALQNRYSSLSSVAAIAITTALPNACQCVQVVAPDGTLGAFDCTNLGNGAKCDVVTSTQGAPSAAPTSTGPAPVPSPPAPPACNFAKPNPDAQAEVRKVNQIFDYQGTFNRVAAEKAIPKFCKDNPYKADNLLNTCATHQSYVFVDEKINDGGNKNAIGTFERIFLSMRWDLGICPNDIWLARNHADGGGVETSEAAKYLNGDTAYDDCVAGFSAALSLCEEKEARTHGAKIQYKCMEFLLFENGDVKFEFPCNNDVW